MKVSGIFDFFSKHRKFRAVSLVAASVGLAALTLTLHFSEDISDFLPLGTSEREHLNVYQNISGADRIVILFSNPDDEDMTVDAIDHFADSLISSDSHQWCESLTYQFDSDDLQQVSDFIYDNIPYFLTDGDFERMDSLLSDSDYVRRQLLKDKEMLLFPISSFMSGSIARDPLGLFSPVLSRLNASSSALNFHIENGYVFTPDKSRGIVMMTSPFGNSETENNAKLLELLEDVSERIRNDFPEVGIDIIGGPAIAVGNSARIKKDSIIAICLSVILIVFLLIYSFGSVKNILLTFLSIGWGLIFALGGMSLFSDSVSIIVIGISSVILGIAVNYPLHLIAHTSHQPDRRSALNEIISPLVVGNITTVGAFMALVPLKSTALRDLGLFASLLLVGTMLFVILYLPHYMEIKRKRVVKSRLSGAISGLRVKNRTAVVAIVALISVIMAVFSIDTGFDSNLSNINYMTDSQKRDMQYFEDLLTNDAGHESETVYAYASGATFGEALSSYSDVGCLVDSLVFEEMAVRQNRASSFIVSEAVQAHRLERWREFVSGHYDTLTEKLDEAAGNLGFSESAFVKFKALLENTESLAPEKIGYFAPLTSTVFSQNTTIAGESGKCYFIDALNVPESHLDRVKEYLGSNCFDVPRMNAALTGSLSDNFNYIGWACSLIVFFFLWFSFGRIELAVISFLPMALSWVWILGLMSVLGIQFNIVNVILATFIFGQGDDYSIFMTEGCQYEYARRKPILASYKGSIIQSAAIMFVGLGTLIVARHPALRSLAEVTIIGMFSVVIMAYLLPPFFFDLLTTRNGVPRKFPITIKSLLSGEPEDMLSVVKSRFAYKGKEIERVVRKNLAAQYDAVVNLDLSGYTHYDYHDKGYGELAMLLAISHPNVKFAVHFEDEDRLRVAEVACQDFFDNIEIMQI